MVLTANTSWKGISTTFSSFVGGTFFHSTVNVEIEIDCLDKQTNGCVELQITQSQENNERKARLSARILLSSANSKGLASCGHLGKSGSSEEHFQEFACPWENKNNSG